MHKSNIKSISDPLEQHQISILCNYKYFEYLFLSKSSIYNSKIMKKLHITILGISSNQKIYALLSSL